MIQVIKITSREQWLSERARDYATASSAPALLGCHPYQTAYGLWAEKTGLLVDEDEDSPPMRRGRLLEPVAVQMLREDRPDWTIETYPVGLYFRDDELHLGATPDLFVTDEHGAKGLVQIKNVEPGIFRQHWIDEKGELQPPLWIAVQALIETYLTGRQWAAVTPLVISHGIHMPVIMIPLHEGLIERIKGEVRHFGHLIETQQPPDPDYARDSDLIARLYDATGEIIDLSSDNALPALLDERESLVHERTWREDRIKAIRTEILHKMHGASAAEVGDGRMITVKQVNRAEYTVKATRYLDMRVKKSGGKAHD